MRNLRSFQPVSGVLAALSYALLSGACSHRPQEPATNVECVTRLHLPEYPPIAHAARVQASFTAAIVLARDGSVESFSIEGLTSNWGEVQSAEKAFRPYIDTSLKASRFAAECGGKTVRLTFVFRLDRHPDTGVWFAFPNHFEIAAEPPVLNTSSK